MSMGDREMFDDLARLRRDLDRFSQSVFASMAPEKVEESWTPPVDIYEDEQALVLVMDLPGLQRDEIDLKVDHDRVTVEGNRARREAGTRVRLERPNGRFRRAFKIGVPVDAGAIAAIYRDGVLRVTIPRATRAQPARLRVEVE